MAKRKDIKHSDRSEGKQEKQSVKYGIKNNIFWNTYFHDSKN